MMTSSQDGTTQSSKQLKVDNWGSFFLHQLQTLYEKNENCDVTLQFHDGGEINVHRLVLTTCTFYFQNLTVTPDNRLVLPPDLKYDCVLPIVNFMYSGKLDYNCENHVNLLITAKLLNMTILVKLLNAQVKQDDKSALRSSSSSQSSTSVSKSPSPGKKVVLPSTPTGPSTGTLPGKKLPFWKKRTTPGVLPDEFYQSDTVQPSRLMKTEPARPTRFEWPEEGDSKPTPVALFSPSFDSISYDSEVLVKPAKRPSSDNPESSQDQVRRQSQRQSFVDKIKRFKPNVITENCFGLESDDDDDDDDGHFESLHNNDDDDDYENDNEGSSVNGSESSISIQNNGINDVLKLQVPPHTSAINTTITKSCTTNSPVSTPKPILKPLTSEMSPASNQSKKVRFSLASEGKENSNKTAEKQIVQNSTTIPGNQAAKVTASAISSDKSSNANNTTNHAKIIAEVLKKYPELVKNNKNIRLKIMTPNNKIGLSKISPVVQPASKGPSAKSKVSYVVMKSELNNQTGHLEENVSVNTPLTGAENTTGPWYCYSCGVNSEPQNFDTYYLYRRHLQDVHMERIDARICEHCGFKSSKRNLHLYHLYTKHNIQPPRNIHFPKCDQCDYIALSDSLLIKHRNNHVGVSKEYTCKVCNAAFKSHGALQGHMQTSLHSDNPNKEYQCDYCEKTFNRNINLKAHIRTAHKDESRKLYDEEDPTPQQSLLQVIQVPVIDGLQSNLKGQQTLLLPAGMTILAESPSVPLLPSSESEALSNVASSIATSLNLNETNIMTDQTVIFLDGNSELLFDQSGNPVVMSETTVVSDGGGGEYIIPEMLASGNSISQVFTTQTQPVITQSSQVVPVSVSVCNQPHQDQLQPQQCRDIIEEITPEVHSNDHTYADEPNQPNEDLDTKSLQVARSSENNEIVIPIAASNQEIINCDQVGAEELEGEVSINSNCDQDTRSVETIQFASSNSSNDLSNDSSNTQAMEVCERDSIIIQPSSVIQHPNLSVTSQPDCLQEVQDNSHIVANDSDEMQCINSNSVIVNSSTSPLLVNPKTVPKDELVRDWEDDFGDDDEVNASCPLEEIEGSERADDIRPSRPTIELEESILPDM